MKTFFSLMSATAIILAGPQASWAKNKTVSSDDSVTTTVSLPVIEAGAYSVEAVPPSYLSSPRTTDLSLSYSNWLPNRFERPSSVSSSSDFSSLNVAQISFDRFSEVGMWRGNVVEYDLGLSYAQLQRSGSLVVSGVSSSVSENMNVSTARVGLELRRPGLFQPALLLALEPTWLASAESAIEPRGLSAVGLLGLASAQIAWSPQWMRASENSGAGFGLAVDYSVGYIAGSDLGALDLRGFGRISY
jgi:hypothetical protein